MPQKKTKKRLTKAERRRLKRQERLMKITVALVSIGCARYNKDQGSIGEAISAADREMYHFKQLRKKKDITIRELELAE